MRLIPFASLLSPAALSDEQAMWRVQTQDDHEAFARLVARWEEPIRRLCARMTGDLHRGEDLAQEAFARVFARRKDYQSAGKFSTFLWRIALNLCYDELRRRQRRPTVAFEDNDSDANGSVESFASPASPPDRQTIEREHGDLVRSALLRLPEIYRAVLVLRHYENLKFGEIAETLGIPDGTVKSRMSEALSRMQALLRPALSDTPHPNASVKRQALQVFSL